jgi:hypothetical protein
VTSRLSKFKGFVYDAGVLVVVVGGLGLACDLGTVKAVDSSAVAVVHAVGQLGTSVQSRVPSPRLNPSPDEAGRLSVQPEQQRKLSGAAPAPDPWRHDAVPDDDSGAHHRWAALRPARAL